MDKVVNTDTAQPADQVPVIRSDKVNKVRFILGWGLMILSVCLVSVKIVTFSFTMYKSILNLIEFQFMDSSLLSLSMSIAFTIVVIFMCLRLFQYGRHLTRPASREFI